MGCPMTYIAILYWRWFMGLGHGHGYGHGVLQLPPLFDVVYVW